MPSGLNATLDTASAWPVRGARSAGRSSASHTRTVLSPLPETRRVPSGLNATLVTVSVCPVSGWPIGLAGVGVPHPHRLVGAAGGDARAVGAERHAVHRVVWPVSGWPMGCPVFGVPHPHRLVAAAGGDAVAVGAERHAASPRCRVPVRGWPMGWPVSASHTRTVLSSLPEAMRVPSGLNATLVHRAGVPGEGWPTGWPVSASHTRTVLSALPVTMPRAVGAERHAATPRPCARSAAGRRVGRCRRPTAAPCCPQPPETIRVPSGLNATLATCRCGR